MEDSMNYSYMNNAVVDSKVITDSPEESGWTSYFEDLSSHRSEHTLSSSFCSSSMVSDAASFPAWKSCYNNKHIVTSSSIGPVLPNIPKKLTFKGTRAKEISHDESLEDTASSPVNSPKVSDLTPIHTNHRKTTEHFNSSLLAKSIQRLA